MKYLNYILLIFLFFFASEAFCQRVTLIKVNPNDSIYRITLPKILTTNVDSSVTMFQDRPIIEVIKKVSTLPPVNQLPIVSAGVSQTITLPTNNVTLKGTASDPDGTVQVFNWTKSNGPPGGVISSPTLATTTVTGLTQGVYVFRLTATDNTGGINSNTTTVTVNPAVVGNKIPIAVAGPDVTISSAYTILDGTGSTDIDGTIAGYQWIKISGPSTYNIDNPTLARCGFSQLVQGVYTFRLTVTDNKGSSASDDINVTVNTVVTPPPPPPPVDTTHPPVGSGYLSLPVGNVTTYNNVSNLIIEGKKFANTNAGLQNGNTLAFSGCSNITIRNCYFAPSAGAAIYVLNGSNGIKVENCLFVKNKCAVVVSKSSGVSLVNCQQVDGFGSGDGDGKDGGLLKLVESVGAGFAVINCRVDNFNLPNASTTPKNLLKSNVEDIISVYASSGTQASPITISGNIFRGGGPSQSGGGIVAGDGTASFTGGWMNITNNTLLNPGQYGIGIAGGSNINVTGNKIYSDQFPWSNNPLFLWNQYAPPCANIVFKGNRVNWTNRTGGKDPGGWNGGGCSNVVNEPSTTITLSEMNVPAHLITFLTPAELSALRGL